MDITQMDFRGKSPTIEEVVNAVDRAFEPDAVILLQDNRIVGYTTRYSKGKWSIAPRVLINYINQTPDDLPAGYCYEFRNKNEE